MALCSGARSIEVPLGLLEKAQRASRAGITQKTVRIGLQLVAASRTYTRLRHLRGKVGLTRPLAVLKDRSHPAIGKPRFASESPRKAPHGVSRRRFDRPEPH